MFPAMPNVPELPRCETCGAAACHFYVDLEEVDPIPSTDADGNPILLVQWKVRDRHARCEIHQGGASRYYQNGALEVAGRILARWK